MCRYEYDDSDYDDSDGEFRMFFGGGSTCGEDENGEDDDEGQGKSENNKTDANNEQNENADEWETVSTVSTTPSEMHTDFMQYMSQFGPKATEDVLQYLGGAGPRLNGLLPTSPSATEVEGSQG